MKPLMRSQRSACSPLARSSATRRSRVEMSPCASASRARATSGVAGGGSLLKSPEKGRARSP
ncbi:MAG: hypothetical protein WKG00_39160 [Polyangiaceae bacterium]